MDFVQLKALCEFEKGSTGLAKAEPGEYPLVATGAERKSFNTYQFDTKAVCIPLVSSTGHGHASLKNVHYQEGKFALGSILVALTSKDEDRLDIQFLHLYLSQLKDQVLVPLMSGAANVALSVKKIQNIEIPLPIIGRQREIVERFKSIVIEEDELKTELTNQQVLLKKLRQQILQDAIEGKLTADWRTQNPNVEPASELLKRIEAKKAALVKAKKIKAQKPLPPISEEEKPFELPPGWDWCRLEQLLFVLLGGYAFKSPLFKKNGTKQVLRLGNIRPYKLRLDVKPVYIDEEQAIEAESAKLMPDDILITMTGTRGKRDYCYTVLLEEQHFQKVDLYLNQRVGCLRFSSSINKKYYDYCLKSDLLLDQVFTTSTGAANQANIGSNTLRSWLVPLPSLEEQSAIVSKVEKLLSICDQLETQISQNQNHAEQLMQAVLKEAFSHNGADTPATSELQEAAHA